MDGRGRGRGRRGRGRVPWRGGRGRGPPGFGEQDPGRGGRGRGEQEVAAGDAGGLGEQEQDQDQGVLAGGDAGGNAAAEAAEAAAAQAVDAGPFPGVGANPFFVGVPSCNFQLSTIPLEMRNQHERVWIWVKRRLAGLVANFVVNHMGEVKEFSSLPGGGFFVVNLIPPEDWDDDGRPIPLVFSFRNLYLLGFPYGAVWRVYGDADLEGTGYVENQHQNFLQKLNFGGGYSGNMFKSVYVGMADLYTTYTILTHFQNQIGHDVVQEAMYRLIIALPEAWRFPGWKSRLQEEAFAIFMSILADNGVKSSNLFQKWSKISKGILGGPLQYTMRKCIKGFADYASLLPVVSVLLP